MKQKLRQLFDGVRREIALDRVIPGKVRVEHPVLEVEGERIDLSAFSKILTVAIGKAAFQMAGTVTGLLQPVVSSGVVVSSVPPPRKLPYFLTYTGGHPLPGEGSLYSASVVLEMLADLRPNYLVLYLLSGGGSAICEKPVSDEIPLDDVRDFYHLLVTCGADIVEINILRKHFSAMKGGRLAARAQPARQMTLYVSDVPPDKPSSIASGPTMPDESTVEDCRRVIEKHGLSERLPGTIRRMLDEDRVPETPKPGDPAFENCSWHGLIDNRDGAERLAELARAEGWAVEIDLSVDDWPVAQAVEHLLARLEELKRASPDRPAAIVTGGELSCPVTGDGKGGRNQAFVLEAAPRIAGRNIAVLSAGTDGVDGNSGEDAAGAVADGETLERAARLNLDPAVYQRRSDSYHFFEPLGDVIATGATGNNIRDLRILAAW